MAVMLILFKEICILLPNVPTGEVTSLNHFVEHSHAVLETILFLEPL